MLQKAFKLGTRVRRRRNIRVACVVRSLGFGRMIRDGGVPFFSDSDSSLFSGSHGVPVELGRRVLRLVGVYQQVLELWSRTSHWFQRIVFVVIPVVWKLFFQRGIMGGTHFQDCTIRSCRVGFLHQQISRGHGSQETQHFIGKQERGQGGGGRKDTLVVVLVVVVGCRRATGNGNNGQSFSEPSFLGESGSRVVVIVVVLGIVVLGIILGIVDGFPILVVVVSVWIRRCFVMGGRVLGRTGWHNHRRHCWWWLCHSGRTLF